jgi:hypothetical protein
MTHKQLVILAARWLRQRAKCSVVVTELVTACPEIPDAIGWRVGGKHSILIECKTSRADFAREIAKNEKIGLRVGHERYILAPAGMLREDELPSGWGLLETDLTERIIETKKPKWCKPNRQNEITLLYSLLLRKCGKSPAIRKATVSVEDETPEISKSIPPVTVMMTEPTESA